MHLSFIHVVVCISSFYLLLSNSPSYGYTSAYLSIHQLKCLFLVFVIVDTAATNLCMRFCFCVCLFLLGRFLGESLGHRASRAFLVAQMVESLPAVWETRVQSLGWEDPLE